jgi:hypothetical protein
MVVHVELPGAINGGVEDQEHFHDTVERGS